MSRLAAVLAVALLLAISLSGLASFGLIGPDEPRYAAIGRQMATSGDWITPRLWGQPWFEKPPLLYWITAIGFRAGLDAGLAPRLPVALLSLAFLAFFYLWLSREFSVFTAAAATLLLANSALWLGFTHVAVTDLPLTVLFCAAVLLMLPALDGRKPRTLAAAVVLALAVLAKGLVPLVLAAPFLWFGRRFWRAWLRPAPIAAFLVVALPWYLLCFLRNGSIFPQTFFLQHQLGRFTSPELQHVQPFWFYLPVLLGALFPMTLFLPFAFWRRIYDDERLRYLAVTVIFGFVFFSASENKLPGYLLPLIPLLFILIAAGIERARWIAIRPLAAVLVFSTLMLPTFVAAAGVAPHAVSNGLRSSIPVDLTTALRVAATAPFAVLAAAAVLCFTRERGLMLFFALCSAGWLYIEFSALPWLDRAASARSIWRQLPEPKHAFCLGPIPRSWKYGLDYYAITPLADCPTPVATPAIVPAPQPNAPPAIRLVR